MMILGIVNPRVQQLIDSGEKTGVSLYNDLTNQVITLTNKNGRIDYKDIKNKEAMQPSSIAFTHYPANRVPIEIMNYKQYVAKNRIGDKMTDENNNNDSWLRGVFENLLKNNYTAKSLAVQQQSQVTGNMGTEELLNSLVETQKAIPLINEQLSALKASQIQTNEALLKITSSISALT